MNQVLEKWFLLLLVVEILTLDAWWEMLEARHGILAHTLS